MAISICPSRKLRSASLETDLLATEVLDTDFGGRRIRKGYLIDPVLEAKLPGIYFPPGRHDPPEMWLITAQSGESPLTTNSMARVRASE
jgi:hypothetical protein